MTDVGNGQMNDVICITSTTLSTEKLGCAENRNSVWIRFLKTELCKHLTCVQMIFRYKLHAIRHSINKGIKVTLLALNWQIKNVLKHN